LPAGASFVLARIEGLAAQPRPSGAKKLQGAQQLWRIRVGGYRVVYAVDDRQRIVDIVRIRHRRDVYW
jgi:mRNA interferase RelE/StbE